MKEAFESTTAFRHFKTVMRGVLAVPKERLDEMVRVARAESPRKGDPAAPGKKRTKRRTARRS